MTKILTFIISVFWIGTTLAQPVVSDVIPNVGDTYLLKQQEASPDPGPPGENQTWDFSDFTIDEFEADYLIKNAADVAGVSQFPGATLVMEVDMSMLILHSFISFTGNAFTDYGTVQAGGGMGSYYDDPKVHFTYPISYLDTGNDTYSGTIESVTSSELSGSMSYVVDGYGTLITPSGTYEDVLRITVTGEEVLSTMGTDVTTTYTETYWYSNDYAAPLYTIRNDESFVMGNPMEETSTTTMLESYSTGTGVETAADLNPVEVYPNPTTDYIRVNYGNNKPAMVRIYSADGRLISETDVQPDQKVDISGLERGVYVAQILIDSKPFGKKSFVKQ